MEFISTRAELWQEADGDRNKWERCSHAPGLSPCLQPVIIRQGCPLRVSDYGAFPLEGNYGERTWPVQLVASVLQVFSKVLSESLVKCRSTWITQRAFSWDQNITGVLTHTYFPRQEPLTFSSKKMWIYSECYFIFACSSLSPSIWEKLFHFNLHTT